MSSLSKMHIEFLTALSKTNSKYSVFNTCPTPLYNRISHITLALKKTYLKSDSTKFLNTCQKRIVAGLPFTVCKMAVMHLSQSRFENYFRRCQYFLAVQNSSIGDHVSWSLALTELTIRVFTTLQSDPRDLCPLSDEETSGGKDNASSEDFVYFYSG